MDIPVIGFSAYSGTGKTTLIEKLVACFKADGLRVAVIKHDAHDFEIDKEGKDSWRFAKAGADITLISSASKTAIIEQRPRSFEQNLSMTSSSTFAFSPSRFAVQLGRSSKEAKLSSSEPVADESSDEQDTRRMPKTSGKRGFRPCNGKFPNIKTSDFPSTVKCKQKKTKSSAQKSTILNLVPFWPVVHPTIRENKLSQYAWTAL